jgi:hypothetical protein
MMTASILLLLPALALTASLAHAGPFDSTHRRQDIADQQAVADFTTAVKQYAELRRILENPFSRLTLGADPEQAAHARRAHRAAILEAHGAVQRGLVFTPFVAAYFRRQIQAAERTAGAVADMWPAVLVALPELPNELEYRVAGRDLLLLDPEVHLVVDVLAAVFPLVWAEEPDPGVDESETCAPEQPPVVGGTPCDAHSELDMCWS